MTEQSWFPTPRPDADREAAGNDLDNLFGKVEDETPVEEGDVDLGALFGTSGSQGGAEADSGEDIDLDGLFDAPAQETPAPASDLDGLFDEAPTTPAHAPAASTDLDGLFDAPTQETPAPATDLDGLFDAPAQETPAPASDLDGLFDEAPTTPAPAPAASTDLDGLFDAPAEDTPVAGSSDVLDDLFEAPVVETPAPVDDSLDDLFGTPVEPETSAGDSVAEVAPETLPVEEVHAVTDEAAQEASSEVVTSDDVEAAPVPDALSMLAMGWATPPPAATRVGGLTPTHRESAKRVLRKPTEESTVTDTAPAGKTPDTAGEAQTPSTSVEDHTQVETSQTALAEDSSEDVHVPAQDEAPAEGPTLEEDLTQVEAPVEDPSNVDVDAPTDDKDPAGDLPAEEADASVQEETLTEKPVVDEDPVEDVTPPAEDSSDEGDLTTLEGETEEAPEEVALDVEADSESTTDDVPESGMSESDAPEGVVDTEEFSIEDEIVDQEDAVEDQEVTDALSVDEELEAALEDATDADPALSATVVAAAPTQRRFNLEERRRRAEEASMGGELSQQVRAYAQAAQVYAQPEHLWPYVDRITGLVASNPQIQATVNQFRLTRDTATDEIQRQALERAVGPWLLNSGISIQNPQDVTPIFNMVYDELIGISVLGPLWRDKGITEILVDAWDHISIERGGTIVPVPLRFRDLTHAQRVARDLAASVSDRSLSPANPLLTAQLPGARITFAYGTSVVKSGISISLRKFVDLLGVEKLLEFGAINQEMVHFLQECVQARASILVSGGTGTGKTTQINALSQFIPKHERVITIEDAFELQLSNQNVLSLQTKEKSSADDTIIITQADLLVNVLRMRPDRIVVGEIREGEGALVMLRSATTGHDGTMTTIHANSPSAAVNERLADLVQEASSMPDEVAKRAVAGAIQLVVQVTRKRGRRFISEISVIDRTGYSDGEIRPEPVFIGELDAAGVPQFRHVGGVRAETELGMKLEDAGFDLTYWEPQE